MKLKIRQDDASMPREDGWSQVGDWLTELRDDDHTKPPGDGHAEPGGGDPWAEALAEADALAEARARAEAEARARAEAEARARAAGRAVIGDQLRMPIMWCEMGTCISWHADRAALGEADTRARAIEAGWRIDALGRLACPRCSRPTPGSGPQARSCRGTGTWPSPGPPGPPPCPATVPSAAEPGCGSGDPGRLACAAAGLAAARMAAPIPVMPCRSGHACRPAQGLSASQRLPSRYAILDAAWRVSGWGRRRGNPVSRKGRQMIQDGAEASMADGGMQVPGPGCPVATTMTGWRRQRTHCTWRTARAAAG